MKTSIKPLTPQEKALHGDELKKVTDKLLAFAPIGVDYLIQLASPAKDYVAWLNHEIDRKKYDRWNFVLAKEAVVEMHSKVLPKVELKFGESQGGGGTDAEDLAYQLNWLTTTSAGIATAKRYGLDKFLNIESEDNSKTE